MIVHACYVHYLTCSVTCSLMYPWSSTASCVYSRWWSTLWCTLSSEKKKPVSIHSWPSGSVAGYHAVFCHANMNVSIFFTQCMAIGSYSAWPLVDYFLIGCKHMQGRKYIWSFFPYSSHLQVKESNRYLKIIHPSAVCGHQNAFWLRNLLLPCTAFTKGEQPGSLYFDQHRCASILFLLLNHSTSHSFQFW